MPKITNLPHTTPPSYYLDGMNLGAGIDAITGEVAKSALAANFTSEKVTSSGSQDTYFFRKISDVTELEGKEAFGFSGSVTFPADGMEVGAKRSFDFSNSSKSSTSLLLIVLHWERLGEATQVQNAKLSPEALATLAKHPKTFRDQYGDYFVYQLSHMTKFTAIWKCTSDKSSNMKSFEHEISGSISGGKAEASASFTTELSSAASKHNVTVEVQYQVVGDAGNTHYDKGDVMKTFNNFREVAKPVPYQVILRHYNTVDSKVPLSIDMDPDVYERVCNVFTLARFVLFLIGVAPGTRSVRLRRREDIARIFSEIHSKRISFEKNPEALKSSLDELTALRQALWLRFQRQDLVIEMNSLTYEDMKRKFAIEHENSRGAWVQSAENVNKYVLGRIGFSSSEREKYAIHDAQVAEVHVSGALFQQQVGSLEFPGSSGINGYVVGLTIEDSWNDGTDGWWCIGRELALGRKEAKVEVKTAGSRGMHWKLHAHYIPSSEYDE